MNKPRGLKHREIQLDLNLYREEACKNNFPF